MYVEIDMSRSESKYCQIYAQQNNIILLLIMTDAGARVGYDKLSIFLLIASLIVYSRNSLHVILSNYENQFSHPHLVNLGAGLRKVFVTAV